MANKFLILAAIVGLAIFAKLDADWLTYFAPAAGDFGGKVVWITGASSGIGASLARDLCRQGARVVLSARRADQLNEVARSCAGSAYEPFVLPLDVTDFEAQKAAFDAVMKKFGRLDSLVLNAGRSQSVVAWNTTLQNSRDLFELNFFAVINLAKMVTPTFIAQNSGQFVVMSSISGRLGTPVGSTYSATKFALHGYFEALRSELGNTGVKVVMVCPGPVTSEIWEHRMADPSLPKQEDGKRMDTARCTALVTKAMYHNIPETWISEQPYLTTAYLATYAPALSRMIMQRFGPMRVAIIQKGGFLYDYKAYLGEAKK